MSVDLNTGKVYLANSSKQPRHNKNHQAGLALSILRRKLYIANYPFGRLAGVAPLLHGNKKMCAMIHDPQTPPQGFRLRRRVVRHLPGEMNLHVNTAFPFGSRNDLAREPFPHGVLSPSLSFGMPKPEARTSINSKRDSPHCRSCRSMSPARIRSPRALPSTVSLARATVSLISRTTIPM